MKRRRPNIGRRVAGLAIALSGILGALGGARAEAPRVDHAPLDRLLAEHVEAGGWVDYAGLAKDRAALAAYTDRLADAAVGELPRDARLATLINAYNAFTLELILEHYDGGELDSIKDIPAAKRWKAKRWRIGGERWSLDGIEHRWIREAFDEPRIHFALVCAAVGCPPLRREAYRAERLDQQLAEQARYCHAHPRWLRYEPGADTVALTRLYKWYGGDFRAAAGGVLAFAARYDRALRRRLERGGPPEIRWLPYDWGLNDVKNRPTEEGAPG